jgi:hypothetical protein
MLLQRLDKPRRMRLGALYGGGRYTVYAYGVDMYCGQLSIMAYVTRGRDGKFRRHFLS